MTGFYSLRLCSILLCILTTFSYSFVFVVGVCFFLKQGPCVVGIFLFPVLGLQQTKKQPVLCSAGDWTQCMWGKHPTSWVTSSTHTHLFFCWWELFAGVPRDILRCVLVPKPQLFWTIFCSLVRLLLSGVWPFSSSDSGVSRTCSADILFFLTFLFSFWYPAHLSQSIQKPIYCTVLPLSHILEYLLAWRMKPKWP